MKRRIRRRFAWWTVPVGLLLWGAVLWTAGLVRVWRATASGGYLRVSLEAGPVVLAGTLAGALALVVFSDHLRRARGLSE